MKFTFLQGESRQRILLWRGKICLTYCGVYTSINVRKIYKQVETLKPVRKRRKGKERKKERKGKWGKVARSARISSLENLFAPSQPRSSPDKYTWSCSVRTFLCTLSFGFVCWREMDEWNGWMNGWMGGWILKFLLSHFSLHVKNVSFWFVC